MENKIDVTRILCSFKTKWKKTKAVVTYTDEMTKEEMANLNKDPELLQIGLDQGYCHTHRWYKIKASFYIVDNTNVRINSPLMVEMVGP